MQWNELLSKAITLLEKGQLTNVFRLLRRFLEQYPDVLDNHQFEKIEADYLRMTKYWIAGYKDPQLDEIYLALTQSTYRLVADAYLQFIINKTPYLLTLKQYTKTTSDDFSPQVIIERLEEFLTSDALLELCNEKEREVKKKILYAEHQKYIETFFNYIVLSGQWQDGLTEDYLRILTLPTIAPYDQQLIVSALTLSLINIFDANKFNLLLNTYCNACDDNVKQRALIGWVFATTNVPKNIFPNIQQTIKKVLDDPQVVAELTELQIQTSFCLNEDKNQKTIQQEIIPDIIKHSNLEIFSGNIVEKKEDPLQEILDPEAFERNIEEAEKSFRKMMDMQKAGVDIYFGGFSHMKTFPFFATLCNWFAPFNTKHPAIDAICQEKETKLFATTIREIGTICDSDKYSLALSYRQIVNRLPKEIRELMANGRITDFNELENGNSFSPIGIRRRYLQNLYRFFFLYPSRTIFNNPFTIPKGESVEKMCIFATNEIFKSTQFQSRFIPIAMSLLRQGMSKQAEAVLNNCDNDVKNYAYFILKGKIFLQKGIAMRDINSVNSMPFSQIERAKRSVIDNAIACFDEALKLKPHDEKAMLGKARALFFNEDYVQASDIYRELMNQKVEKYEYILAFSVCLINQGEYDKIADDVFRIAYEQPENLNVKRILARILLGQGKFERAEKLYIELIESKNLEPQDIFGFAFCLWLQDTRKEASIQFARYINVAYPKLDHNRKCYMVKKDIMESEKALLSTRGIGSIEAQLMVDTVVDELEKQRRKTSM